MGYYNYYAKNNKDVLTYEIGAKFLKEEPIILCVGSSNVVCDCFGPIVGEILSKKYKIKNVYGNLDFNVNSTNVVSVYNYLKQKFPTKQILIIDSAIGEENDVGLLKFFKGGCIPNFKTNNIIMGDYSILGITNVLGVNGLMFLRNVKFKMILQMASFIAQCVNDAFKLVAITKKYN